MSSFPQWERGQWSSPSAALIAARTVILVHLLCWVATAGMVRANDEEQEQRPCSLCQEGVVLFPDKVVGPESQAPANTCEILQTFETFLSEGSAACDGLQAVGTMCGCDVPSTSCSLCWDGTRVMGLDSATTELPEYDVRTYIPASPDDMVFTCESLESFLHTVDATDSGTCHSLQASAGETCGCPPLPEDTNDQSQNTNDPQESGTDGMSHGNSTVSDDSDPDVSPPTKAFSPCNLCPLGETVPLPDKQISFGDSLPIDSCRSLESFVALLDGDSIDCVGAQTLGSYCGCSLPPSRNVCTFCPNGEPVPHKDREVNWISELAQDVPAQFAAFTDGLTCEVMEAVLAGGAAPLLGMPEALLCLSLQLKSSLCGCSPDWKQIAVTWSYRISAALSLLGSVTIIVDILRRKRRTRWSTYHQIMLGVSFCDIISSTAMIPSTMLSPVESGLYGALGNDETCKAQALLVQFGLTSIYYSMGLSVYFLLVIVNGWREERFRSKMPYFHSTILLFGAVMAVVAYPSFGPQLGICGILTPPTIESNVWYTVFYAVPVMVVMAVVTVSTVIICVAVYRQEQASKRWSAATRTQSLSRKVFWQSFWFMGAFYLAFPILLASFYRRPEDIELLISNAILFPSQGWLNALVHFQRSKDGPVRSALRRLAQYTKKTVSKIGKRTSVLTRMSSTAGDTSVRGEDRFDASQVSGGVASTPTAISQPPQTKDDQGGIKPGTDEVQNETSQENDCELDLVECDEGHDIPQDEPNDVSGLPKTESDKRRRCLRRLSQQTSAVHEFWKINKEDDDS